MIRPQGGTKRLHLAKFKTRSKSVNRRTVSHRPILTSSLKSRENRQSRLYNQDWFYDSLPTHQHWNATPRFLLNKDKLQVASLKKREFQPRKQYISQKGRDRIQMIQDSNRMNNLKQIDRMLLSYKMRMLKNLNKTPTTPTIKVGGTSGTTTTSKKIVPNQATIKQLKQIVQKHMTEIKGGPNVPKQTIQPQTRSKK